MTPSIDIRRQRPDHPQVAAMLDMLDRYLGALYAPEDNRILDLQALLAPEVQFFAAWLGADAVGCGAIRSMTGESASGGQRYGEIKRMFVLPERRGQRVAERLLSALERAGLESGLTLALLETGRDQAEAIRLYERCGYRRHGPFGGYPDNGLSLFYSKALA